MFIPNYKIKVFVSSACGKGRENYNIARAGLKALIESTQLAKVYLFEDSGTSSLSAGDHYLHALQDSDVCIFLIDNEDGVLPGVQKEIDCVNKHNIKSMYYFCDKTKKEETPLQRNIMGSKFSKSTTIHSFEDFIKNGTEDLLNDIILIYEEYCKRRIQFKSEEINNTNDNELIDAYFETSLVTSKNVISNIDKCKNYFQNMIINRGIQIKNTNSFDDWCSRFLTILFENKSISEFNMSLFFKELKQLQESKYHEVILKRWDAIQSYFLGDLQKCVDNLNEALVLAKINKLPDWIVKDILIDLRNQRSIIASSQNSFYMEDVVQNEIQESENPLHYPLLDRFASNLYEECLEDGFKEKIKSPYSVVFGDSVSQYIEYISNIFIVSMFNASLTQLLTLYKKIQYLAFSLAERYSDWNFRILMLKMSIINKNTKEIDGITDAYSEILSKMNSEDALQIYKFSNNQPIQYQRFICNLEALKIVGYFLEDKDFDTISQNVINEIKLWMDDENSFTFAGSHIFDMLSKIYLRLNADQIAILCITVLKHKRIHLYNELFKFVGQYLDINSITNSIATELLEKISLVVADKNMRDNVHTLESCLCILRKQNRKLTEKLDLVIYENMGEFYQGNYLLETTINEKEDIPLFIRKYIEEIKMRNKSQGVNGRYIGYMDSPHQTVRQMIKQSKLVLEEDLLDDLFGAACCTLLKETQTITTKCEALELVIYLSRRYPELIKRNSDIVKQILVGKKTVETGNSIMTNLTDNALRFAVQFLYNCFGETIDLSLIEVLPYITNDVSALIQVSKIVFNFLDANHEFQIESKLETILLQCAIQWCSSDNLNVRWYAIQILFQLLRNQQNLKIICNQLVRSMDTDNVYIKNSILKQMKLIKDLDKTTYEYLLQKASLDTNYVVRKVYSEVILKV